jgi:hypothetical protein
VLALAFKADGSFVTAGSDDLLIRHGLSRHGPLPGPARRRRHHLGTGLAP